jgi:hypothetical protein
MSKGVLLFAFNNGTTDYYAMAIATAKRVNHFLNLPVTVVTDSNTKLDSYDYSFDKTIIVESDNNNRNTQNKVWINKGRYQAYELSPYEETLLLDTDYLINSDKLLRPFEFYNEFMCHNNTNYLMMPNMKQEYIGKNFFSTLWATVIYFKKTYSTKLIFDSIKMIQDNYQHYINIYSPYVGFYRNDFALTFALRTVNGQTEDPSQYIPWELTHVSNEVIVKSNDNSNFNTTYTLLFDNHTRYKVKKEFMIIEDMDFHMMNKENFMEIV